MMTRIELVRLVEGLDERELEHWIEERWVLPETAVGEAVFDEADLARAQLIRDLRELLQLDDETLPVVLSLLDQVYLLRRRLRALCTALDAQPDTVRRSIAAMLRDD